MCCSGGPCSFCNENGHEGLCSGSGFKAVRVPLEPDVSHCVALVTDCWHDFVLLTISGCMSLGDGHCDFKQSETIKADPSIISSHPL